MKKYFSILSLLALLSCSTAYQQIVSLGSTDAVLADNGDFVYSDDDYVINQNFWANGGAVSFIFTNNTDRDVYVDLSRSFLIVNGMTFDYFQNRTWTSYGSSLSMSGSTVTSTTNSGVNVTESSGLWIPAHASRSFCEFSLMNTPFRKCGFARNPSKREDASLVFSRQNTPFTYENMIMVVADGKDYRIINRFFVQSITNIKESETYKVAEETNCKGDKTGEEYKIYKFASHNKFYVNYIVDPLAKTKVDQSDRVKPGKTVASPKNFFNGGLYQ